MNILYLPLEFESYESARKWPYPLGVGLIEGFQANGINFTVIPMMYHQNIWMKFIKDIIIGTKFDQVWLEVVHSQFTQQNLEFIASLAPVRVGIIVESLTIHSDEWKTNAVGTQRRVDNVNMKMPYLTHLVVTDSRDVDAFDLPTLFDIAHVPDWFVRQPKPTTSEKISFFGTTYGERGEWISKLEASGIGIDVNPHITKTGAVEYSIGLPQRFEAMTKKVLLELPSKTHLPLGFYPWFLDEWTSTRKQLYKIWSDQLYQMDGFGILNPPHRTQVLSSRVVESAAAGKVVFSPFMKNRADFIFINNLEVLLYDDVDELIIQIKNCIQSKSYAFQMALFGNKAVEARHTTDVHVNRILNLVQEGK